MIVFLISLDHIIFLSIKFVRNNNFCSIKSLSDNKNLNDHSCILSICPAETERFLDCQIVGFAQFLTVLCAEFIRAVRAAKRFVGVLPESLREHHDAQLPDEPHRKGHQDQRLRKETAHRQHRCEHHEVIPVEDPARRAAPVVQDQPERTPDQHADQIAHVERHGDQEQDPVIDDICLPQHDERNDPGRKDDKDLVGRFGRLNDVLAQVDVVDRLFDGAESHLEQLLRTERQPRAHGNQLQQHIKDPQPPQQMEHREMFEEIPAFQDIQL